MAKQTQVMIDAMDELYEHGYVRTTNLTGYQAGDYSDQTAARVLRAMQDAGYLTRTKDGAHTYYPTDRLTRFERPELD